MRANAKHFGRDTEDAKVGHVRPRKESRTLSSERSEERYNDVLGTEEHEDLERALPSVRAAVLGKGGSSGSKQSEEKPDASMGEEVKAKAERIEEEGGIDFEQDHSEERCIPVRMLAIRPSEKEVARHNLTHVPFRPWCEVCVRGAANASPHKPRPEPFGKQPEVHYDYAFFRDKKGDREHSNGTNRKISDVGSI